MQGVRQPCPDLVYNRGVNLFGEGSWSPRRDLAVVRWSEPCPQVGSYRLGPMVRQSALGTIWLAVSPEDERVLELEHYTGLEHVVQSDPEGALMLDLAHVMGLRHRHLATIIGAGLLDGAPYVVRPHLLGRTLADVLGQHAVGPEPATGVLYAVAEVLGALAAEGPRPGACAMGGFDAEDIFLGFDGSILLTGAGLARGRGGDSARLARDLLALVALADQLLPPDTLPAPEDAASWALALRRAYPDRCGLRTQAVGRMLRACYCDAIPGERAALGLPTLH